MTPVVFAKKAPARCRKPPGPATGRFEKGAINVCIARLRAIASDEMMPLMEDVDLFRRQLVVHSITSF